MTSLDEVRSALLLVADQVRTATELAGVARAAIDEALGVLERLGAQTAEPLPPPQLRRAADELERGIGFLQAGVDRVAGISGRL